MLTQEKNTLQIVGEYKSVELSRLNIRDNDTENPVGLNPDDHKAPYVFI